VGYSAFRLSDEHQAARGIQLTDAGTDLAGALDETNYCIGATSGAGLVLRGLRRAPRPAGACSQEEPLRVTLAGCPLDEKISNSRGAR
jgi:hypothetical protein